MSRSTRKLLESLLSSLPRRTAAGSSLRTAWAGTAATATGAGTAASCGAATGAGAARATDEARAGTAPSCGAGAATAGTWMLGSRPGTTTGASLDGVWGRSTGRPPVGTGPTGAPRQDIGGAEPDP